MADPFVAEIRIFGFNFAPTGWAFCNGQLLPIPQNTALFALLGTMYGGNGQSTFALPNLEGNVPVHAGQGPGLSLRDVGEMSGSEFVTLIESEMPQHTHTLRASADDVDSTVPGGHSWGQLTTQFGPLANPTTMAANSITLTGGSLPHNNLMPYLVLNFCIAMQGVFPPRQ